MLLTLVTLTYFNEFLQTFTKIMSSSSNFQLLPFVSLKLYNSLSCHLICFLGYNPPKNTPFWFSLKKWRENEENETKQMVSLLFFHLQRTCSIFKERRVEESICYDKITKIPLLMPLVSSSSIYPIFSALVNPSQTPIDTKFEPNIK